MGIDTSTTIRKPRILPFVLVGVLLAAISGVGAYFLYTLILQPRMNPADETPSTVTLRDIAIPVYPGASAEPLPADGEAGKQAVFQSPDNGDAIAGWYQTALTGQGFSLIDTVQEGTIQAYKFKKDDPSFYLYLQVWTVADEQTGFSLAIEDQPVVEATAPEVAAVDTPVPVVEAATSVPTPLPVLPIPVNDVQLTVSKDRAQIIAGTLNRLGYTLSLVNGYTGTITTSVKAALPDTLVLMVDDSPGIHYYPAEREVVWEATLAEGETQTVQLVVVTDLFIKPGEILFPVYLDTSKGGQTRLTVDKLPVIGVDGVEIASPAAQSSVPAEVTPETVALSPQAQVELTKDGYPLYPGAYYQSDVEVAGAGIDGKISVPQYRVDDATPEQVLSWYQTALTQSGYNTIDTLGTSIEFEKDGQKHKLQIDEVNGILLFSLYLVNGG